MNSKKLTLIWVCTFIIVAIYGYVEVLTLNIDLRWYVLITWCIMVAITGTINNLFKKQ